MSSTPITEARRLNGREIDLFVDSAQPAPRVELTSPGFPFAYEFILAFPTASVPVLEPVAAAQPFGLLSAEPHVPDPANGVDLTGGPTMKKKSSTSINTTTKFTGLFLDTTIDCNSD
ncbi:hypothetical protein [Frankia sp. Cppng1_Ct_nod]|uniref:hypothetical protein n=1 Tax=Frankia sp. Cppng1_Ct_nod TaxID=2897162 RepID=UPI00104167EC|nr:hypothetical protein [Frankia sp. Cppng1_Ct_nod]